MLNIIKLRIINLSAQFMSNNLNVIAFLGLLYYLIMHILLKIYQLPISTTFIVILLAVLIQVISHIKGITRGMMISTIYRNDLDRWMKKLDEKELDN